MTLRAAGYVRVSTAEQVENGLNLAEDRERVRERAEAEGWTLVDIFDDGGRQGDDLERPGLRALFEAVEAGRLDVVILRDLDRLTRDRYIYALAVRTFETAGVRVYEFGKDQPLEFDLATDVRAAVAQDEKRKIGARVRQSLDARARKGRQTTGRAPLGYKWTGPEGDRSLEEHPAEAGIVRRIFASYAAGRSTRAIVLDLIAEGIPTRAGGQWSQSSVGEILRARVYVGKLERRNGEVIDGGHPALIDGDTWARVERMRVRHSRTGGRQPSDHLLTNGLARCGLCGAALLPREGSRPTPKYVCKTRLDLGADRCPMPPMRMDAIDEPLREALSEGFFDVQATLSSWRGAREGELTLAQEARDHAEQESAGIERRLAKVERGWQDEVITDDDYKRQRADLLAEHDGAAAALRQTEARVQQLEQDVAESDIQPVLDALEALKSADLHEFRRILRSMFAGFDLVPLTDAGLPASWAFADGEGEFGHDGPGAEIAIAGRRFLLMPRLRPEFVDGDLAVIRQPLPPLASTGRLSSQRR